MSKVSKFLDIQPEKCTGCRLCEIVCSLYKEKVSNPERSRIRVLKWEEAGLDVPMTCQLGSDIS